MEVAAEGFFARASPYLLSLGARVPVVVRASSLSIGTPGSLNAERLEALAGVCAASNSRFIIQPLGCSFSGEILLATFVPISLTPTSLRVVADHVASVTERCGTPGLIEPITTPLRVPGSIAETDFLNLVCRQAGCRLLIDVTTLLVASRNHHFDPHSWLAGIDDTLVAAARISGCSVRGGRWYRDDEGDLDEAAWALMQDLVCRARPEVLLLGARERPHGTDGLRRNLERLRRVGSEARVTGESTKADSLPGTNDPHRRDGGHERVEIAADVSLFVLDREGLFVSESRHELSIFNTQATFVWCLLEDSLSIDSITERYQKAFGLAESDAIRHVGTIVQQWFGLGYISNPRLSRAPGVPLVTALAQILTNEGLRLQFRESPQSVADALRVRPEEADCFVRLDPDELDAQAEEVARARSPWRRSDSAVRGVALDDPPAALDTGEPSVATEGHDSAGTARRYRLLTTTFSIRVDSDLLQVRVHEALAHLETPEQAPDIELEVRRAASGSWILLDGTGPPWYCQPEGIVPAVKQLLRVTAVNRHDFLLSVHGAVVSFGEACVLMPASAGSGKTTLTAGLIRSGATYFSDELALLAVGTLAVRPVPLALTIKDGSLEVLRRLYPEIDALTPHLREDSVRVRYLPPPAASLPSDYRAQPVRWIVFPRYDPAAETILRPIERPAGLRRLLAESVLPPERLDRSGAESLVRWMRTVECYELPMSSLDEAVGLVETLAARTAQ